MLTMAEIFTRYLSLRFKLRLRDFRNFNWWC